MVEDADVCIGRINGVPLFPGRLLRPVLFFISIREAQRERAAQISSPPLYDAVRNQLVVRASEAYIPSMSNLDQYYSLKEMDRAIVTRACKAGDSRRSRQMIELYFPKIHPQEVAAFIKQISNLATSAK
jgi:hypothetical protein